MEGRVSEDHPRHIGLHQPLDEVRIGGVFRRSRVRTKQEQMPTRAMADVRSVVARTAASDRSLVSD